MLCRYRFYQTWLVCLGMATGRVGFSQLKLKVRPPKKPDYLDFESGRARPDSGQGRVGFFSSLHSAFTLTLNIWLCFVQFCFVCQWCKAKLLCSRTIIYFMSINFHKKVLKKNLMSYTNKKKHNSTIQFDNTTKKKKT